MNIRYNLIIIGLTMAATACFVNITLASTSFEIIQPAENNNVASIRVGTAQEGGVSFFNGSIVNEGNAATIADDLRVDGYIYRKEIAGRYPVKVDDSIIPTDDDILDFGSMEDRWNDIYIQGSLSTDWTHNNCDMIIVDWAARLRACGNNGSIGDNTHPFANVYGYYVSSRGTADIDGIMQADYLEVYNNSDIEISGNIKNSNGDNVTFGSPIKVMSALNALVPCNKSNTGGIYFDDTLGAFMGCNGSSWEKLH